MISIKVFQLNAGPRSAKVVQVRRDGSINSELPALSAAVGETIEFSSSDFLTIIDKKIRNIPLDTDLPFAEIGINHGSYIVVKKKILGARITQKKNASLKSSSNLNNKSILIQQPSLNDSKEKIIISTEVKEPITITPKPNLISKYDVNFTNNKSTSSFTEEKIVNLKQEEVSLTEDKNNNLLKSQKNFEDLPLLKSQEKIVKNIESQYTSDKIKNISLNLDKSTEEVNPPVELNQNFNDKLLNEITTTHHNVNSELRASFSAIISLKEQIEESLRSISFISDSEKNLFKHINDTKSIFSTIKSSVKDISSTEEIIFHENLLQEFFSKIGQTKISVSDILTRFNNFNDLYSALSIKYNLPFGISHQTIQGYLLSHFPSLASANPVICFLYEGHEVEYLESIKLKSIGLSLPSPQTWLKVIISNNNDETYYYSSFIGLSQRNIPKWAQSINLNFCHIPEMSSICPRLSLFNPQYMKYDNSYRKWFQSKIAALILYRRSDLQENMDFILKSYIGKEELLLKIILSSQ